MKFSKARGLSRLGTVASSAQPAHTLCFYILSAATASL